MSTHRLDELPPTPRRAIQLPAAGVLEAARFLTEGKLGLVVTPGGFGTPEFAGLRRLVIGTELRDGTRTQPKPLSALADIGRRTRPSRKGHTHRSQ